MVKVLPVICQDSKHYFLDVRLKQLRNCFNPHDYLDLNDFEVAHYQEIANGAKDECSKLVPFDEFKKMKRNLP